MNNEIFFFFCLLLTSYLMRSVRICQKSNVTSFGQCIMVGVTQVNVCRCPIMTSPIWNRVRVWIRFLRGVEWCCGKIVRDLTSTSRILPKLVKDHETWKLCYLNAYSRHFRSFCRWKQHQLFEGQWKSTQLFHDILKNMMSQLDDLVLWQSTQGRCCLFFLKPRNATDRVQFTRNQAGCSLQSINQM